MSISQGDKIFVAPALHEPDIVPGRVERTGPTAFLWRGTTRTTSGLVLFDDEGITWCRDDSEDAGDALLATRKLLLSGSR